SRALEPEGLVPYQPLLDGGQLQRYYLDEMPELAEGPLGLSILYLIGQQESQAVATARRLVARCRIEIAEAAPRADLIQLIETVILYKLSQLSREEVQAMLQMSDIRQTWIYQDAKEEGRKEGIEEERQRSFQERLRLISKMAALKMSADDIAGILDLDVEL